MSLFNVDMYCISFNTDGDLVATKINDTRDMTDEIKKLLFDDGDDNQKNIIGK